MDAAGAVARLLDVNGAAARAAGHELRTFYTNASAVGRMDREGSKRPRRSARGLAWRIKLLKDVG